MKNITIMAKNKYAKNNHRKDNSKNRQRLPMLFYFGIVFFDDMLSSPGIRTSKKAGLVCGGSLCFLGAEIKTTTEHTTLTEIAFRRH